MIEQLCLKKLMSASNYWKDFSKYAKDFVTKLATVLKGLQPDQVLIYDLI